MNFPGWKSPSPAVEAHVLGHVFAVLGAHGRLPADQAGVGRFDAPQAETAKVADAHLEMSGVYLFFSKIVIGLHFGIPTELWKITVLTGKFPINIQQN